MARAAAYCCVRTGRADLPASAGHRGGISAGSDAGTPDAAKSLRHDRHSFRQTPRKGVPGNDASNADPGMRTLLVLGVLAALLVPLTASGGTSAKVSASDDKTQRQADLYQIDQIEANVPPGRLDAQRQPDDVPLGSGRGLQHRHRDATRGKAQIRNFFATENKAFLPQQPLGVRHAVVQDPGHPQRRQGDALLRVPLRRREDREGGGGRRRRPQPAEDQRQVADHRRGPESTGDVEHRNRRRMAQPEALERRPPRAGGRRSPGRTTGSCARLPARRPTCARSCSSRSSGSPRCSSSSASLGLRFLGQANARVERLGTLQLRVRPPTRRSRRRQRSCGSCSASRRRASPASPR